MNNLMIDRRNAEKELQGKIAEMLMPMQPEAADLKAGEILKLFFNFYVSGSADTEQEYINTKALGTITAAINTLRDLVPENLPETIKEGESKKVMGMLYDWQDRLFREIKTESE